MYGFAAGFGFSITENLMYMRSSFRDALSRGYSMQIAQGKAYTQSMDRSKKHLERSGGCWISGIL